jgi:nucleoside phosphorylase
MGNTSTAIEVTAAVVTLKPHLVLFVGIAGSAKPKDLVQGDIVVADRVYNLHRGKDADDEVEGSVHLTRPISFTAAHGVVQLAMDVRRRDWTSHMTTGQALNAHGTKPRVEIKPIAAGETVHADGGSSLMQKVRRNFNDVAALDMESLGFYEAAYQANLPALAVRGISDRVTDKAAHADSEWQPRASLHAAAFAFALLHRAEPEDLPAQGTPITRSNDPSFPAGPSPAQQLLRVAPPVAVAYEWTQPTAGPQATTVLRDLAALGDQPATWLSRFRHRQPSIFRGENSAALWVLVGEFADSHEHPAASWIIEQAAERWQDHVLSAYLYAKAALAAMRDADQEKAEVLFARAEAVAPAGKPLWMLLRTALSSDVDATGSTLVAVTRALELPLPQFALLGLQADAAPEQHDNDFVAFIVEFSELYPAFLELIRWTVTLIAIAVLRHKPEQIDAAQLLCEQVTDAFPAYRSDPRSTSALAALAGTRSSRAALEMASILCMRATGHISRVSGFDRDAALARAEEIALTARGRRQDWGGPTSEALALAAQARALSGDTRGALTMLLEPPAGIAEKSETRAQPVILVAAGLAAQVGNIDLALEFASKIDEPAERHLATAFALSLREDSHPESAAEYRAALSEAKLPAQENLATRVLIGLSAIAPLNEAEEVLLGNIDIETADLIRARSMLKVGQISQAQILARRYPDSSGALEIRVLCLLDQGKTAEAIRALENFAVRHFYEERHLLQAALLAHSSGTAEDAARLATRIASSTDPVRRRTAQEILVDVASRHGDWSAVMDHTSRLMDDDAVAECDPNRDESLVKYRWARAHALHQLRLMPQAYEVVRTEPRLEPSDLNQARLIASILRTIAPSVSHTDSKRTAQKSVTQAEVLSTVSRAAQAFPDDEELVATAVMTAFLMPDGDQIDYQLMAEARRLHQQFFERFPDSKILEMVPVDENFASLQNFLQERLAPISGIAEQMYRAAITGQIPISALVTGLGNHYADSLIRNTVDCYMVRNSDERINSLEVEAARQALETTVVVDTSSLFLSSIILEPDTRLHMYFEQLFVTSSQRDDIIQTRTSLLMRSSGSLGWDPHTERPVFNNYSDELKQRWADQAEALATALDGCDILPDPPSENKEVGFKTWSSPVFLARKYGLSLVADDAALRAAARSEGVAAFGSLQLVEALIQDGRLPSAALKSSYGRLMKVRAADLPLNDRLGEIAENEQWDPNGYAAFLLTRPTTWLPLAKGWQTYTALIKALPEKRPQIVAEWCVAALGGLCMVTTPSAVPTVASALVASTLLELQNGAPLPLLLDYADRLVSRFAPDTDLLKEIVQRLVLAVRHLTPPEMVGTIVLPLLADLKGEAHVKALRIFFTMP